MSVRTKTLIVIGLTSLALLGVLYPTVRWFLLQDAMISEDNSTTRDVTRLLAVLDGQFAVLDSTVADWAQWDDTYSFITSGDTAYIDSNLPDTEFTSLGVELMLFIDSSDKVVYGKMVDLDSGAAIPIPKSLSSELQVGSPLLSHKDPNDKLTGILSLPEGPMIISSQAIVTSLGEGPIRGTLIMGRRLNEKQIGKLMQTTLLSISSFPYNALALPEDVALARNSLVGVKPIFVADLSETVVSGYTLINDVYGYPALILRVDTPRAAFMQANTSMRYLGAALLSIGIALCLVTMFLLDRLIIIRLTSLNSSVMKIGSQGTPSSRVEASGNDEIFALATSVNSMLDSLQVSREKERESDQRYSNLATISPVGIFRTDQNGATTYVNSMYCHISGLSVDEALGTGWLGAVHPEDKERLTNGWQEATRRHKASLADFRFVRPDGTVAWVMSQAIPEMNSKNQVVGYVGTITDITARKQAEEALSESEDKYRNVVERAHDGIAIIQDKVIKYVNPRLAEFWGGTVDELIGMPFADFIHPDALPVVLDRYRRRIAGEDVTSTYETTLKRKDGNKTYTELNAGMIMFHGEPADLAILRDIGERKQAEETLRQRLAELEALHNVSAALRKASTYDEALPILLDETLAALDSDAGAVWLYDPEHDELRSTVARGWFRQWNQAPMKPGEGIAGRVFASGQAHVSAEFRNDPVVRATARDESPVGSGSACVPIRSGAITAGVLFVSVPPPRQITTQQVKLLESLAEMAGASLHRMSLYEATVRQLDQLQSLHDIDRAISGSVDLRMTLNVILEQAATQLQVDAAAVLLLNPYSQTLEYAAGRGFRSQAYERTRFRLGEGQAGLAALERRIIQHPDFAASGAVFAQPALLAAENVAAYFAVPLIAKGEVKGVLEIFHRSPFKPNPGWLDFLETLAGQAAIAIDGAQLFDNLQRSNVDLTIAYDRTIEGWSRALDLRDQETEGHTLRVTELAVRLARAAGLGEAELVHIRRGALLHDIGKMGVPDSVLLKPGPLTGDEWLLMRKHPQVAHDMLSPIAYLKAALDIPYCHHEKWDGTGYPRGLKGEHIPLAARLFAVVDVWDALLSDRPYRGAWPEEKVIAYIKAGSGNHFDPKAVELFFKMISEDADNPGRVEG